jgi:predicted AlkP superfamily phosphohydrolase/phosphomutase
LLLAGCADGRPETADAAPPTAAPASKVALIGWDGATWTVIDPLLRRGELPNVARLLERGARGTLLFDRPLLSPVVWTTLATGFPANEHGITDFQLPDPHGEGLILAASIHRRRAPLWKIASASGLTVGFVGWWTTWPAEPVRGFMVSDHLAYNRWDAWARRPEGEAYQLTFPPGLAEELAAHAVRPKTLEEETLVALVPFNEQERREMMEAERPVKFHAPSVLRFGYATDASNAAFASYLLDSRGQPDLFGAVFILSDVAGHVFWHHHEPERYGKLGPDVGRLGEAIPNVYRRLDAWTGEILDRLDPGTTVVLLSDHGMAGMHRPQPGVAPSGDHTPEGILVISGSVPAGADLGTVPALDVTPTVLSLLGLPLARDMPGRPVRALQHGEPRWVDSHGEGSSDIRPDSPSPGEEEYEERLRSLGYIQ